GVPTAQNCLLKSMGAFGRDLPEEPLKNLAKASDFQAEYEGSIPFTRSNVFKYLRRSAFVVPTSRAAAFLQTFLECSPNHFGLPAFLARRSMRLSCASCLASSLPCR